MVPKTKNELPEYKKKEKTIFLAKLDTVFASIKDGMTSSFIIPFALAMNATSEYIALISTLPQLVGSFFQLFSSDLLNLIRRRKRVIAFTALLDAVLWIPILLIPFVWENNYILLMNFLIVQSISTSLLNPFFNSLLGDIVPQEKRGVTFGRINQISGILTFFSSLGAGLILSIFAHLNPFIGFAAIFFMAFLSRLISAFLKSRFYEPEVQVEAKAESLAHFSLNIRKSNFGQFVMYTSWIKFAVGISAPFFAVYMLNYMKMDFLTFSLINAAAIISSFLVLSRWGRTIDANGSRWMLGIAGFLIPINPLLWILFKSPLALFVVELFSGATWAAYNLSVSNFVMDATTSRNRLIKNSYFNFFIGLATFLGAMVGGYLMRNLPLVYSGNIFYLIFAISALLRFSFSLYFLRKIKEERFVGIELKGPKAKRIITVTPKQGAVWEFIPRKKR